LSAHKHVAAVIPDKYNAFIGCSQEQKVTRKLEISNKESLQAVLKAELQRLPESRLLHRLHCVLLVAEGHSCYEVACWFGENPRTVERWVHHANEYGIEGLRDEQKQGRSTKLRDDQRKRLQDNILTNPKELGYGRNAWNGVLLQTHLKRHYGIELSVRQCQRLLRQLQHGTTSEHTVVK
jgi:transposase